MVTCIDVVFMLHDKIDKPDKHIIWNFLTEIKVMVRVTKEQKMKSLNPQKQLSKDIGGNCTAPNG